MTEPLPLPLAPAPIVIHAALLPAVQPQPVAAVTLTEPVPPAAEMLADGVAIAGAQVAPACVTVNVWPATVNVPVRDVVSAFAATA